MLAQRAVEPTSSVERACRILRALSDPGVTRLTDIAVATGLDKTTVLRLLEVLMRDGFVVRDTHSKHYSLGAELLVLGAAALARFDPRPLVRPALLRLTGQFEDSVILSIPSGIESLCVDVEEGRYPIRANYLSIGSRRPLGLCVTGGLLLSQLLTLYITPVLYTYLDRLGRWRLGRRTSMVLHKGQPAE